MGRQQCQVDASIGVTSIRSSCCAGSDGPHEADPGRPLFVKLLEACQVPVAVRAGSYGVTANLEVHLRERAKLGLDDWVHAEVRMVVQPCEHPRIMQYAEEFRKYGKVLR